MGFFVNKESQTPQCVILWSCNLSLSGKSNEKLFSKSSDFWGFPQFPTKTKSSTWSVTEIRVSLQLRLEMPRRDTDVTHWRTGLCTFGRTAKKFPGSSTETVIITTWRYTYMIYIYNLYNIYPLVIKRSNGDYHIYGLFSHLTFIIGGFHCHIWLPEGMCNKLLGTKLPQCGYYRWMQKR